MAAAAPVDAGVDGFSLSAGNLTCLNQLTSPDQIIFFATFLKPRQRPPEGLNVGAKSLPQDGQCIGH